MQPSLATTSSSGTQTTTQSPQSATQGGLPGITPSNIQANNSLNLFNGQSGVTLKPMPLATVNLSSAAATTKSANAAPATKHHVNGAALSVAVLLFIIALGLVWLTIWSAKNTTD